MNSSTLSSNEAATGGPPVSLTDDQRATAELQARFRQSPYAEIRRLAAECHEGVASLRGSVPTYYVRQIAITLAQSVWGVEAIEDRIAVDPRQPSGGEL